jgi:hypothetical protein
MESSQKDEENSSELTTKDQENWGARNNDQKFINWESSLEPSFEWDRAYSDTPHISVSSAYEDPSKYKCTYLTSREPEDELEIAPFTVSLAGHPIFILSSQSSSDFMLKTTLCGNDHVPRVTVPSGCIEIVEECFVVFPSDNSNI